MKFVVHQDRCVGCLACARVCPTGAIAVPETVATVSIIDPSCIRCGLCLPACPEDAISALGNLDRAVALAGEPGTVLILGTEAPAHFYPATPEQVVNACYAAGFTMVSRGVLGDELVAQEYVGLWESGAWPTIIRSSDPVVVAAITLEHPALVRYLAPVATPPVAEARYLREQGGAGLKVVYAGSWPVSHDGDIDAVITFEELERLFQAKGVFPTAQPTVFSRIPMERRRHLSLAGGFPAAWLTPEQEGPRILRVRGLDGLRPLSRALERDAQAALGFVDVLSCEGALDHPLAGPREDLFWRRTVVQLSEPPRSQEPVVMGGPRPWLKATFAMQRPVRKRASDGQVESVLEQIGTSPTGRPWDCGACGVQTCREFAEGVAEGRTSLRLCPFYLQRQAVTDPVTGLGSRALLVPRLDEELKRTERTRERFAVLFLDLDRLKQINDVHGHLVGDTVIREVAQLIKATTRSYDLAVKYGGDEFVVVLQRIDPDGAYRVAEALRSGVEALGARLGLRAQAVTVSIGVYPVDPSELLAVEELLLRADRAMYEAKAQGRNRIVMIDPSRVNSGPQSEGEAA